MPIKKNTGEKVIEITHDTSHHVAHTMVSHYDLDFESKSFWHICIKELKNKTNIKDIQLFFEEFDQVSEIVITVKDVERPWLGDKNFLILELGTHERKMYARLFWALLPREKKNFYEKKYADHYERLQHLLFDAKKEIILEEY